MIDGTYGNIASDFSPCLLDDAVGGELAKARTDIAGRYAQLLSDFLCGETPRAAPQNLEDSIRKFRHFIGPSPAETLYQQGDKGS
jgi:hypothetical protein